MEAGFSVGLDVELERRDLERYARGQRFGSRDRVPGDGFCHCMFDLALRVDADHLQELPNAQIEGFFVHWHALLDRRSRTGGDPAQGILTVQKKNGARSITNLGPVIARRLWGPPAVSASTHS